MAGFDPGLYHEFLNIRQVKPRLPYSLRHDNLADNAPQDLDDLEVGDILTHQLKTCGRQQVGWKHQIGVQLTRKNPPVQILPFLCLPIHHNAGLAQGCGDLFDQLCGPS